MCDGGTSCTTRICDRVSLRVALECHVAALDENGDPDGPSLSNKAPAT